MNKRVVIFADGGGRLGNQLNNHAHLMAWATEYASSVTVINLSFWTYTHLFQNKSNGFSETQRFSRSVGTNKRIISHELMNWISFGDAHRWQKGLMLGRRYFAKAFPSSVIKVSHDQDFNLSSDSFYQVVCSRKVSVLFGHGPRNWSLLAKHQELIRNMLTFHPLFIRESSAQIARIRENTDILVGVHVRQGDYAAWRNGKYYFSLKEYQIGMKLVQEMFSGHNVHFLIASSSIADRTVFDGMNVTYSTSLEKSTHYIGDMYELSQCDLILGPPSTFSAWAAFLGQVPILPFLGKRTEENMLMNHLFDAVLDEHFSEAVH